MKILFLDDMPERWGYFWENLKDLGADLVWVQTAEDAANALSIGGKWDIITLDHDLGEEHYTGYYGRTSTGLDLARWMVVNATSIDVKVLNVHSYNPDGALRMVEELEKAWPNKVERNPFGPGLIGLVRLFARENSSEAAV